MILAELEVFHSRPYTPTRRVALGRRELPCDPAPGFGPLLLGGIVAIGVDELEPDVQSDLHRLTLQLEDGRRIPQPRLRHRFQADHVGLGRTNAMLVGEGEGESIDFDFDGSGSPMQMALAAVYAAGQLPMDVRPRAFAMVRKAMRWRGAIDAALIDYLSGPDGAPSWAVAAFADPVAWALGVLGYDVETEVPARRDVQRTFRKQLRTAHPDHGGASDEAAQRIADLAEARRILLG